MKQLFKKVKIRGYRLDIIEKANTIIDEYKAQGFVLTLRGIYYQFVRRDWFPDAWKDPITGSTNNARSYKKLGDILGDGRLSGLVDWDAMKDEVRHVRELARWSSPADAILAISQQYRNDLWRFQKYRPVVWVEKNALVSVLEPVCEQNRVGLFACLGSTSLSSMYEAAQQIDRLKAQGQEVVILHLGDHDPSGVDMSRDIQDRLEMFCGRRVMFRRLALNMAQIRASKAPPNPVKLTDANAKKYIKEHGRKCWELDALEPQELNDIVQEAIDRLRNNAAWDKALKIETTGQKQLAKCSKHWPKVAKVIGRLR